MPWNPSTAPAKTRALLALLACGSAALAVAAVFLATAAGASAASASAKPSAQRSGARKTHCRHPKRRAAGKRRARPCRAAAAIQMPEASPPRSEAPPPAEPEAVAPPAATIPPGGDFGNEAEPPGEPPLETEPPGEPLPETEPPGETESHQEPKTEASHFRFFSPTSPWNTETSATEPLDPLSASIMANFNGEIEAELAAKKGPSINTERWSIPVYTVPANQPLVRVEEVEGAVPSLQSAWNRVPVPDDAVGAAGTDKHLVIWQPSSDKLWEFWRFEGGPGHFTAQWGGAMEHASTNPGVYGPGAWPGATYGWGASATSLSIAGGLVTLEDLERGEINHALALGIPQVRAGVYSIPAHRGDGTSQNPLSLPEGAHLRLDPNLDLDALHLPHFTYMLAKAAQRYGIYVRSRAGVIVFYGQDPTPTGTNPYQGPHGAGVFEGRNRLELLSAFPWSHLQLSKMALFPDP